MTTARNSSEAGTPEAIERVLRALSSKPRREIVRLLSQAEAASVDRGGTECCSTKDVCACVFAEKLGLSAPTVSHHMRALAEAGLVAADKRGLWVYYTLVPEPLLAAARELERLAGCLEEDDGCGC